MSFDPSDYNVKNAIKELASLSLGGLESVLEQEIDGKHRSSLIAEIGRHIDAIKTAAERIGEAPEAAAPKADAPEEIGIDAFMRIRPVSRRGWKRIGPNRFIKVG